MNTILNSRQGEVKTKLQQWAKSFATLKNADCCSASWAASDPKEQDVFIGFSEDVSATVILQCSQSSLQGNFVFNEEQVLGACKSKLIECATPDSILRLKYSSLEDAKQIQDLYFGQKKHSGLIDILRKLMKDQSNVDETNGLCLQVSTHARLLNQRELDMVTKKLNLQNRIWCVFLSQFETEHAFRQEISKFFRRSPDEKLLLVQFSFDEPQSSKRLLACAKYCIVDERRKSQSPSSSHVVIISKVPRIQGGSGYLAFSGDKWTSLHLDELLPPEHFSASLGQLSKITVAEVFTKSTRQGLHTDGSTKPGGTESVSHSLEESVQLLDVEFLIKQCVQKAVIQLEDKRDNQKRATIRIQILYDALFPAQKKTAFANDFMGVLKKRICHLLQEREERSLKPKEWTFHQAMSGKFILEGTSFRHTLWIYVEDIMVNVFAQILAVIDANNNLNCISQETPRSSLWLQMFQDESFLKIKYTSKEPDAKIAVLSMTEDPNTYVACQFPFSWVLKAVLDEIWETVHQAKGFPRDPTPDSIEMFQSSTQNVPMPDGDDMDMIQFYASDFVRMALPGQDVEVYKVLSNVLITGAKKLHSSVARNDLKFSLLWLHVEYFYLRDTYQLFIDLVKNEESITGELQKMYSEDSTKMFLSLDALNTILRQLQPTEETFGSFDSCLAWLKRIKSIKHALNRVTSDDYQIRLDRKKGELLSSILHQWDCTNITYLLIDHLLHDETKMDEKLLKTIVKQSVFLWKNLYKTDDLKPEKIFEVVTKVLKICSSNAVNVYFVKGVDKCRSCQKEITDPAELPCEHIFCTQCILSWTDKQCRICKKNIPEDYTPTASQVTREAVENCNKFRRKCNSFFLECVSSYCFGGRNPPPAKVIEQLIKFVACKPSNSEHTESTCVYKPTSDLSPFEECMDPSPTVKSSLLKMLLQCRFDDVKTHLQEYISLMEGVITSNQSIRDDFYFMVVCCFEDFMYSSFQEDASQEAEQSITSADLTTPSCTEATEVDTLQLIARLRLAISHVATVLGTELLNAAVPTTGVNHEVTEKQHALVNSMKILVENAQTPWPQIFLMRALLNIHGLKIMKKVLEKEQWILPRGCETSKCMDVRSNEVLMISALGRAKHHLNNAKSEAAKHLTSVMKQMESILEAPLLSEDPMERLEKIMNAIRSHGNSTYLEVVFHTTVILSLSQRPITQVFRSICFEPSTVKDTYLPTMPDDRFSDMKNWKMDNIKRIWSCKCGQLWCIDMCGLPMEEKTCSCGHPVGGLNHKPVEGFVEVNRSKDIIERGYILESPGSRSIEGERDLPPASVCLARVLLHSSMLLGTFTERQSVLNLMKEKPEVAEEFFQEHLEKDITFLAESLGRNIDDATIIVHLFLRYLLDSTEDEEMTVKSMHEKEDRKNWESCFKTLTHSIFQGLKDKLASAKQEIAEGAHSSSILKIAEGQTLPFSDLSSTGLINKPCIWQFEQKMTVQHLTHLIQQENGTNQFPVLLEILSKHQNIQYMQHLPDVLSLQHTLIHFYQNCNHEEEQFSVREFLEKPHISGDQRLSFEGAVHIIQKVWSNIKLNPESSAVDEAQNKEIGTDTAILDLLPHDPSISSIVTKFLIELQNSFIDTAAQIMKEKQRSISAEEVRASSVIAVTPGDVVTMALSNFQYVLEENGIKTTHFNFQTLQRQAINRFISGKPIIKVQTAPSMPPRNLKTLKSTKAKVKQQRHQEQLSVSQMKSIMETARSVSDISRALSTLKVAAEFLAVTGGDPKRSLTDYVRNELRMAADAKHFKDLPVVPQTQLKHILSLWQVLSVRRSVLLVQMNQNPFFLVDKRYQEELEVTEREDLKKALSTISIDFFITDLHEMIVVTLADYEPEWEIVEIFRAYLEQEEKEDMYIENLIGSLSPHLQMKKVISVWKTAVQTSKLYGSSYKQE
ncbi:E3 ubiquitin-protein ligase RNF213-like [Alligator sinensis]|uniref:E3 ubiquitin-protein ligase RNF213-like n=1 Tax=Alligator sinensis TaxID=38654 RepID=A0A1U8DNV2_ALLSI|nr:E3 ubiquitin-protein ligase RNF213-like [Alligator sinensis]